MNKKEKEKSSYKARLTNKTEIPIGNLYLSVLYPSCRYCIMSKAFTFTTKDFVI